MGSAYHEVTLQRLHEVLALAAEDPAVDLPGHIAHHDGGVGELLVAPEAVRICQQSIASRR